MTRVATIDVGTNSILLLVVDLPGERVVEDRCRIERLGRGVGRTGVLDPAAVAGALAALEEYADLIGLARVERVAAVGTQALREARNGADFLAPARQILGVPVEVIDGRREAELAFGAVRRDFPALTDVIVCDIGGGSTELIVGRAGVIESWVSLPIGSVRMTERFLADDPPTAAQAADMLNAIDRALDDVPLPTGWPLVATAGTATTIAAVALGLEPYRAERVQGMRLGRHEVERQLAEYLGTPVSELRTLRGMEPRRADVIAGGAAVLARVLARTGANEAIISDRGVRWGLAYELGA